MATLSRPIKKWSESDWFSKHHALSSNSEIEKRAAIKVQDEARFLKNETNNRAKWGQYESNSRLADRIDHVNKWKDIMEIAFKDIETELHALSAAKFGLEHFLEIRDKYVDANTECLTLRDSRRDHDNVFDDAEKELREVSAIHTCRVACRIEIKLNCFLCAPKVIFRK